MTRNWTIIIQLILAVLQAAAASAPIPPEWLPFVHTLIGLVQTVQAVWAHNRNPDGTPAEVDYRPPSKPPIGDGYGE